MSLLIKNSTPAERMIGCSFAETFESNEKVIQNGMTTVGGNPTIDFGATFDGTVDYLIYNIAGNELAGTKLSFEIEFFPDFTEDGVGRTFFSSTGDDYLLRKDTAENLSIKIGDVTIAAIPKATWTPFWNEGGRNTILLTSTSGDSNMWLNGNQVLTNDNTAWTETAITQLSFGALIGTGSRFDGKITKFKVYKSLLTAQDATNFYNNSTYNYRNQAVLDLPMRMSEHDPTNVRTLDISRNANHGQLGDGSTPSTYPTKKSKHGYDFDGTTDYIVNTLTNGDPFNNAEISIVTEFCPDFDTDENLIRYLYDATDNNRFIVFINNNAASNTLAIYMGQTLIALVPEATYSPYWNVGRRNVLVISGTDGDTSAWLNGNNILANDNTSWTAKAPTEFYVGSRNSVDFFFDGEINSVQVYQKLLGTIQVADITLNSLKKINKI